MAKGPIKIDAFRHTNDKRLNIPTAELESVMQAADAAPLEVAYSRRNRDLDPQLVWRGKDEQDWSDLIVNAPPLYIQEKVHPQVLIDDLRRMAKAKKQESEPAPDLFADFNGLKDREAATEFYKHDQHWSNRMILGDSLAVMASLAEREALRGKVQCIYFDPPYGIKFNSNFQWSTTSRDVKDGAKDHFTREPEMVRAFRDTWKDGIHSYLTYLRDRLTVARDLLHESGSIFVQIGDENVALIRDLLAEVFGDQNFMSQIAVTKSTGLSSAKTITNRLDYIIWVCKNSNEVKYRSLFTDADPDESGYNLTDENGRLFMSDNLTKPGPGQRYSVSYEGKSFDSGKRWWGLPPESMERAKKSGRLRSGESSLRYKRYFDDFSVKNLTNLWDGIAGARDPVYVVQTSVKIVERCILMTTDPGDLVLDPTCGSGTTAYVAEQWGRRWITIDTSRVSLALARSRLMGARYPYYILADSSEGQKKEAEITRTAPKTNPTHGNIRHGFVYERVPHITLKSIANNAEIDVIWDKWQEVLEPLRGKLNAALGTSWEEWEIPREADAKWSAGVQADHRAWWDARIARQKEIDASIAAKADHEYLYDKPYTDSGKVRVSGPFTVESLSPHRVLAMSEDDELIDILEASEGKRRAEDRDVRVKDFAERILENLFAAGVQQRSKSDRITFSSVTGWPGGRFICAEGIYTEGNQEKRAGILVGPEFGTVSRPDLVAAAREAAEAGFDLVIACAFNYDAHANELTNIGKIPILQARMNPDLMMSAELKATGAGNLFVVFGEPDIRISDAGDGNIQVQVFGVDVFKPQLGEVQSEGTDGIALWMIDTDYNDESFFVRQCYFLGANDPYKGLKTTLKTEIDEAAWSSLYSDLSRPFPRPKSGRIAVKVINHLGDEVMKVFPV